MYKLFISLISTLLISNIAWGEPVYQSTTNSLFKAVLEIVAMNAQPQEHAKVATPYSHESEKNNSLARAVLAIQEANVKVDSNREVNNSQTDSKNRQQNSFFNAILEKQFSQFN